MKNKGLVTIIITLLLIFNCSKERNSTRKKSIIYTSLPEIKLEYIGNPCDGISFRKAFVTDIDRGIDTEVILSSDVTKYARIFTYNPINLLSNSFLLEGSKRIGAFAQEGYKSLYIGTSIKANLFKYDLKTKLLQNLNVKFEYKDKYGNLTNAGCIWAMTFATDRQLYIGVSPGAHLFSYNTKRNILTYIGNIDDNEIKITSLLGTFGDKLYISTFPGAKIYEYDLISKKFKMIIKYKNNGSFENMTRVGDRIIATLYPAGRLIVINPYRRKIEKEPETPEIDTYIPSLISQYIVPDAFDAYLGFIPKNYIYQYRYLSNDWLQRSKKYGMPFGVIDQRYFFCLTNFNELNIVDKVKSRVIIKRRLYFLDGGEKINTLCKGPDQILYGTCISNPHLFSYNPAKDKLTDLGKFLYEGRNVNNLISYNKFLYITFSDSKNILRYDPSLIWNPGKNHSNNPESVFTISKGEGIGRMIKGTDNNLYFTTYPALNQIFKININGENTKITSVFKSNQKINTFIFGNKDLIIAGTEKEKSKDQAHLILWDYEKNKKILDIIPVKNAKKIRCLYKLSKNILYGAADSTLFAVDILNKKLILNRNSKFGDLLDLVEDNKGNFYALSTKNLLLIDKNSNEFTPLLKREEKNYTDFIYKDPVGNIFICAGKKLYRLVND